MRLEVHPEARTELRRAALWYDQRRSGLGDEFVAGISGALDRIAEAPECFPPWPDTRATSPTIRKATIHRFPYAIAFERHEQHVLVLPIAHTKRRPLYWLTRASP